MTTIRFTAEAGKQEVVVTTILDAPRAAVFKAVTDAALIPRWWGPRYLSTTVEKLELTKGGLWRFLQYDPQHHEYAFNGVYHAVIPPERMLYTFEYEGAPGHVVFVDVTFEEREGRTTMTERSVFLSADDRDEMLAEGMKEGAVESMERLAELVNRIRNPVKEMA